MAPEMGVVFDPNTGAVLPLKNTSEPRSSSVPLVLSKVRERRTHLVGLDEERALMLKVAKDGPSGDRFVRGVSNRLRVGSICPSLRQPAVHWVAVGHTAIVEEYVGGRSGRRLGDLSPDQVNHLLDSLVSLYVSAGVNKLPARSVFLKIRRELVHALHENGIAPSSFPFKEVDDLASKMINDDQEVLLTALAHGDFVLWLNVIWLDDETPVIIDWEDAGTATILYDPITLLAFESFRGPESASILRLRELAAGRGPFSRILSEATPDGGQERQAAPSADAHVFLACLELIVNRVKKKSYPEVRYLERYFRLIDEVFESAPMLHTILTSHQGKLHGGRHGLRRVRRAYREHIPERVRARIRSMIARLKRCRDALRKPTPARIARCYTYRRHGLRRVAADGLRLLFENERIYPYQPLWGVDKLDAVPSLASTERPCHDRWAAIEPHLPRRGTFLDIGCQHGYFVFRAAEHGLTALGIEREAVAHEVAKLLAIGNGISRASFIRLDVSSETVDNIPPADVVACLSVFHHWVRNGSLEEATSIMQSLTNKCGSTLFFETGQNDEQGAWWAPLLDFMGDDPEAWTISYLESLGFSKVESLGRFEADHVAGVPRTLFLARK